MMNFWKRIMFCLMTLALIAGAVSLPLAEDGPAFVMAANAEGVGSPVIPPHEHRGGGATCTQAGVCDVCGEVYIDPQGHDWGGMDGLQIQPQDKPDNPAPGVQAERGARGMAGHHHARAGIPTPRNGFRQERT